MKSSVFDERYARLNISQREAVDTIEGPVMVIAGPGTGKTTILTLRIANILRLTDTPPSGILAITYTEAGVRAMRMKLREIIGNRADEVRIHTFHGFAASVISEFNDHFTHLARSKQMTDIDAEHLVRDILKQEAFAKLRPLGDPEFYVSKIIGSISDAKREAWTPEMIADFARKEIERIQSDEASLSTRGASKGKLKADALKRIEKCERSLVFAGVYAEYEQRKRTDKKMDFDDLIIEILVAFRNDELLLRLIQEKFLYLLVDEHQDTNDSQNLLVRMIADFFDNPNIFVVGDEKQAIYRFQGASVENFLTFQTIWKSMKLITLEDNYRSTQSILDASFSLIEQNYENDVHQNLRVKLISGSGEESRPLTVVSAGNNDAAEKYLIDALKEFLKLHPDKTAAIIARTNRDAGRIISLLRSSGISASSERGIDIFAHSVGMLFFDLIRYLVDPSQIEALARTIAGGLWQLSFEERTELIKLIRSGTIASIEEKIPVLKELREELVLDGAVPFIMRAATVSGLVDIASRDIFALEVWRGLVLLVQELALRTTIEDPSLLMGELISYHISAESKTVRVSAGTSDAPIHVMTAHGSKGLEFDEVFVVYATEESWMSQARASYFVMPREKEEGEHIRDARRLFYVALTRARSHASIIFALEEAGGKTLTPLRFIDELDSTQLSRIDVPALEVLTHDTQNINSTDIRVFELAQYAKRVLGEKGLSVTALNHFLQCPNLFLYKSILKVPEAPSASSEKGNAMHQALSQVWSLEKKTAEAITNTIKTEVSSYFSTSFLPAFEKARIVQELHEAAPIVSRALLPHFLMEGSVSTEGWVETLLDDTRLHGKLDVVIDAGEEVFVFDYKTREAMSENEIKGDTKSSTGDYFRQLIFYAILLEGNPRFKGKKITPALVFVKPDKKDRCPIVTLPIEKADIERVKAEVRSLVQAVQSGKLGASTQCEDEKCRWCAFNAR